MLSYAIHEGPPVLRPRMAGDSCTFPEMPPTILSDADWAFLCDRMRSGDVILFLGAGFSDGAINKIGQSPPLGRALAEILAKAAGFDYGNEPLSTVYAVAQQRMGSRKLQELLESQFLIETCAKWHLLLPTFVWRRIYTTNIDTVLDVAYEEGGEQRLSRIVCPAQPSERDQLLDVLQAIHLHGCLAEPVKPLTFTLDDFARQTVRANTWYQQLADDLFVSTILFIGTELQDSPFHHYVEQRGQRDRGEREFRPKSFLVSPGLTAIRKEQLSGSNIIATDCSAEEFFTQLRGRLAKDATAVEKVRSVIRPDLIIKPSGPVSDPLVGRHFYLIRPDSLPRSAPEQVPGQFFLGAEPAWGDIQKSRDAHRDITGTIIKAIVCPAPPQCTILHGPAGSGKSTTAMRLAVQLAADGWPVWFANSSDKLDLDPLLDKIHADTGTKCHYVFIDVATRHYGSLGAVRSRLKSSPRVSLLLIDRTNAFAKRQHALDELNPIEISMPDLSDADIRNVLERLDRFGFLGVLKGKAPNEQFAEFKQRAEKQLLVAMREATSGRGFDLILRDEYEGLQDQARSAYLITCLAVSQGASGVLSKHLRACLEKGDYAKGLVLADLLRGVLVAANDSGTLLKPRHRLIAHWVCREIATDDAKFDAIVRYLHAVSGDIVPNEIRRRSPAFLGYRGLVNSDGLAQLFANQSRILDVYESVRDLYSGDFLFWLHFGMAHMAAGRFDTAENYLNQSLGLTESLNYDNFQAKHQLGILHLRIATNSSNPELATERAAEGIAILHQQILARGLEDTYPYAAYLQYVLAWYRHAGAIVSRSDWESLREIGKRAKELYFRDAIIADAVQKVEHDYLMRAVATR